MTILQMFPHAYFRIVKNQNYAYFRIVQNCDYAYFRKATANPYAKFALQKSKKTQGKKPKARSWQSRANVGDRQRLCDGGEKLGRVRKPCPSSHL